MKYSLLLCAILLSSARLRGQCVKDYQPKSADEAEIVRLENQLCDAAIKRDASRLSEIFADDLIWTENDRFTDKAGVMRRYMVDQQEIVIELRDVKVKVEGDIAVVISHVHVVKKVGGKTIKNTHTDGDVFRKRNGKWQMIVA